MHIDIAPRLHNYLAYLSHHLLSTVVEHVMMETS